jgi:RNA methyltransferase, TrmH family
MVITSRQNERVKAIRALRDCKAKDRGGSFLAEGIGLVAAALQAGAGLELVVVAEELCGSEFGLRLLEELSGRGVPRMDVSPEVFSAMTDDRSHGLLAVVREKTLKLAEVGRTPELWVAMDSIQYPANLGTILRTADATGATGIILLDASTDPFSTTVVRASRGAIFTQGIVRSTVKEFAQWKKAGGCRVIGTSPAAKPLYTEISYARPLVLLMGSERYGLLEEHIAACDELVRIPMLGKCDSLNVAVAASLVMYEAVRWSGAAAADPHT